MTDGNGGYGGNLQRIEVTSVNDAPELLASAAPTISSIQEDSTITITANQLLAGYGDADDDTLSIAADQLALTDPSQGVITGDATSGWTSPGS